MRLGIHFTNQQLQFVDPSSTFSLSWFLCKIAQPFSKLQSLYMTFTGSLRVVLLKHTPFLVFQSTQQIAEAPHMTRCLWSLGKDFIQLPNLSVVFSSGLTK
jgi:predicted lactoylglutathione lyase